MKFQTTQKFIRVSPRKIRTVSKSIKNLSIPQALLQLKFSRAKASDILRKTILQAVANATNNHNLSDANLKIHTVEVNEGPTFKRWRAVSRGRAHSILKRTSHIKVILDSPTVSAPTQTKKSSQAIKPSAKTSTTQKSASTQPLKPTNLNQSVDKTNKPTKAAPTSVVKSRQKKV